eukprot:snap_masked-scaffold_6-processed-gene-8.32-mRNA-1 protein AED:1.00 eAED:1.00 QI:0/-1/0/0/-1/1/1/0/3470
MKEKKKQLAKPQIHRRYPLHDHTFHTKISRQVKLGNNNFMFSVTPQKVVFRNYEVFKEETKLIKVKNLDAYPRRIVAKPFESDVFSVHFVDAHMSLTEISNDGYRLAPGIEACFRISFYARNHQDCDEKLIFHSESEVFSIDVQARGVLSELRVPKEVEFNQVPVNCTTQKTVLIRNTGHSSLLIFCELFSSPGCLISVKPEKLSILSGKSAQLTLSCEPKKKSVFNFDLMIWYCDGNKIYGDFSEKNLHKTSIWVKSNEINVSLSEQKLSFGSCFVSLSLEKQFFIRNDSDVPISFEIKPEFSKTDFARSKLSQAQIEEFKGSWKVFPKTDKIWSKSIKNISIFFCPVFSIVARVKFKIYVSGREHALVLRASGTGMGPEVKFSPSIINFGNLFVTERQTFNVQLRNVGEIDALFSLSSKLESIEVECEVNRVSKGSSVSLKVHVASTCIGRQSHAVEFVLYGALKPCLFYVRGNIIPPCFNISTREVNFGCVGISFEKKVTVCLENKSRVPIILSCNQDASNKSYIDECLSVFPIRARVNPFQKQQVELKFCPTRKIFLSAVICLLVEFCESPSRISCYGKGILARTSIEPERFPSLSATISHQSSKENIMQQIRGQVAKFGSNKSVGSESQAPQEEVFDLGQNFIGERKTFQVGLRNESSVFARVELRERPLSEMISNDDDNVLNDEDYGIKLQLPCGNQVLPSESLSWFDIHIAFTRIGALTRKIDVFVKGFSIPHSILIQAYVRGPRIVLYGDSKLSSPLREISFGKGKCLATHAKTVFVKNESPISAKVCMFLLHNSTNTFGIVEAQIALDPFTATPINILCNPCYLGRAEAKVAFIIDQGRNLDNLLAIVSVIGVGHTLRFPHTWFSSDEVATIDFGYVYTREVKRLHFSVDNVGHKVQRLLLAQEVTTSVLGENFSIEPTEVSIEPGCSCTFIISCTCKNIIEAHSKVLIYLQQKKRNSWKNLRLHKLTVKGTFIRPDLIFHPSPVGIFVTGKNFDNEVCDGSLVSTFEVFNSSKLSSKFSVDTSYPFRISHSKLVIKSEDRVFLQVYMDLKSPFPRESIDVSSSIIFTSLDNGFTQNLDVRARIRFADLKLSVFNVDFGAILMNSLAVKSVLIHNVSEQTAEIDFELRQQKNIFSVFPLQGILLPGGKMVLNIYFFSFLRVFEVDNAIADLICDVADGPRYEVKISGREGYLKPLIHPNKVLDFGEVSLFESCTKELSILNSGTSSFVFSIIVPQNIADHINISSLSGSVEPNQQTVLIVTYSNSSPEILKSFLDISFTAGNGAGQVKEEIHLDLTCSSYWNAVLFNVLPVAFSQIEFEIQNNSVKHNYGESLLPMPTSVGEFSKPPMFEKVNHRLLVFFNKVFDKTTVSADLLKTCLMNMVKYKLMGIFERSLTFSSPIFCYELELGCIALGHKLSFPLIILFKEPDFLINFRFSYELNKDLFEGLDINLQKLVLLLCTNLEVTVAPLQGQSVEKKKRDVMIIYVLKVSEDSFHCVETLKEAINVVNSSKFWLDISLHKGFSSRIYLNVKNVLPEVQIPSEIQLEPTVEGCCRVQTVFIANITSVALVTSLCVVSKSNNVAVYLAPTVLALDPFQEGLVRIFVVIGFAKRQNSQSFKIRFTVKDSFFVRVLKVKSSVLKPEINFQYDNMTITQNSLEFPPCRIRSDTNKKILVFNPNPFPVAIVFPTSGVFPKEMLLKSESPEDMLMFREKDLQNLEICTYPVLPVKTEQMCIGIVTNPQNAVPGILILGQCKAVTVVFGTILAMKLSVTFVELRNMDNLSSLPAGCILGIYPNSIPDRELQTFLSSKTTIRTCFVELYEPNLEQTKRFDILRKRATAVLQNFNLDCSIDLSENSFAVEEKKYETYRDLFKKCCSSTDSFTFMQDILFSDNFSFIDLKQKVNIMLKQVIQLWKIKQTTSSTEVFEVLNSDKISADSWVPRKGFAFCLNDTSVNDISGVIEINANDHIDISLCLCPMKLGLYKSRLMFLSYPGGGLRTLDVSYLCAEAEVRLFHENCGEEISDSYDFGTLCYDLTPISKTIRVENTGKIQAVKVMFLLNPSTAKKGQQQPMVFSFSPSEFGLLPGKSTFVKVSFLPNEVGVYSARMGLIVDEKMTNQIELTGIAAEPVLQLCNPYSERLVSFTGLKERQSLVLRNKGKLNLSWWVETMTKQDQDEYFFKVGKMKGSLKSGKKAFLGTEFLSQREGQYSHSLVVFYRSENTVFQETAKLEYEVISPELSFLFSDKKLSAPFLDFGFANVNEKKKLSFQLRNEKKISFTVELKTRKKPTGNAYRIFSFSPRRFDILPGQSVTVTMQAVSATRCSFVSDFQSSYLNVLEAPNSTKGRFRQRTVFTCPLGVTFETSLPEFSIEPESVVDFGTTYFFAKDVYSSTGEAKITRVLSLKNNGRTAFEGEVSVLPAVNATEDLSAFPFWINDESFLVEPKSKKELQVSFVAKSCGSFHSTFKLTIGNVKSLKKEPQMKKYEILINCVGTFTVPGMECKRLSSVFPFQNVVDINLMKYSPVVGTTLDNLLQSGSSVFYSSGTKQSGTFPVLSFGNQFLAPPIQSFRVVNTSSLPIVVDLVLINTSTKHSRFSFENGDTRTELRIAELDQQIVNCHCLLTEEVAGDLVRARVKASILLTIPKCDWEPDCLEFDVEASYTLPKFELSHSKLDFGYLDFIGCKIHKKKVTFRYILPWGKPLSLRVMKEVSSDEGVQFGISLVGHTTELEILQVEEGQTYEFCVSVGPATTLQPEKDFSATFFFVSDEISGLNLRLDCLCHCVEKNQLRADLASEHCLLYPLSPRGNFSHKFLEKEQILLYSLNCATAFMFNPLQETVCREVLLQNDSPCLVRVHLEVKNLRELNSKSVEVVVSPMLFHLASGSSQHVVIVAKSSKVLPLGFTLLFEVKGCMIENQQQKPDVKSESRVIEGYNFDSYEIFSCDEPKYNIVEPEQELRTEFQVEIQLSQEKVALSYSFEGSPFTQKLDVCNFGVCAATVTTSKTLSLRNSNSVQHRVEVQVEPTDSFYVHKSSFMLPGKSDLTVTISFAPGFKALAYSASCSLLVNKEEIISIALSGISYFPVLSFEPLPRKAHFLEYSPEKGEQVEVQMYKSISCKKEVLFFLCHNFCTEDVVFYLSTGVNLKEDEEKLRLTSRSKINKILGNGCSKVFYALEGRSIRDDNTSKNAQSISLWKSVSCFKNISTINIPRYNISNCIYFSLTEYSPLLYIWPPLTDLGVIMVRKKVIIKFTVYNYSHTEMNLILKPSSAGNKNNKTMARRKLSLLPNSKKTINYFFVPSKEGRVLEMFDINTNYHNIPYHFCYKAVVEKPNFELQVFTREEQTEHDTNWLTLEYCSNRNEYAVNLDPGVKYWLKIVITNKGQLDFWFRISKKSLYPMRRNFHPTFPKKTFSKSTLHSDSSGEIIVQIPRAGPSEETENLDCMQGFRFDLLVEECTPVPFAIEYGLS